MKDDPILKNFKLCDIFLDEDYQFQLTATQRNKKKDADSSSDEFDYYKMHKKQTKKSSKKKSPA